MSVTDQDTFNSSQGNGVTTVFPYSFKLVKITDLKVAVNGVLVTTGFSVSGIGNDAGGNITFVSPPGAVKVLRYRDIPLERTGDFQENGDWKAAEANFELDRIWQALQGLSAKLDLKPGLPLDDYPGVDFSIPPPVAGGYWRWKLDGSAIEYVTFLEQNTPVSPYGADLILSEDAEAARELLDFDERVNALILQREQDVIYRVGSVYCNMADDTSPAEILGYGTWVRIAGRTIIGLDPDDDDLDTLGGTAGNKTHQLSVDQLPKHHVKVAWSGNAVANSSPNPDDSISTNGWSGAGGSEGPMYSLKPGNLNVANVGKSSEVGNDESFSLLGPTIIASMWRRTA